jgi:hypothetical protein
VVVTFDRDIETCADQQLASTTYGLVDERTLEITYRKDKRERRTRC